MTFMPLTTTAVVTLIGLAAIPRYVGLDAAEADRVMPLLLGEWARSLDGRFRLSLPPEWVEVLSGKTDQCVLAKERPGCVSVWNSQQWEKWLADGDIH